MASSGTIKIKSRIASVTSAYKVTSAMKLVSTVKLQKWKNKMVNNRLYADEIKKTTDYLLSYAKEDNPYLVSSTTNKNLYILISSTLGLCGSYNNNLFKVGDQVIAKDDDAIIVGKKGMVHYSNSTFHHVELFDPEVHSDIQDISSMIANYVIKEYQKGTYQSIHMISSFYKNSLSFLPKDDVILPLKQKENQKKGYGPLVEPNEEEVIQRIVPFYINTIIYSKFLESEVCEYAARSNAMENATDNAKELLDNLKIEFNKARQASITQEIIEIVAASSQI